MKLLDYTKLLSAVLLSVLPIIVLNAQTPTFSDEDELRELTPSNYNSGSPKADYQLTKKNFDFIVGIDGDFKAAIAAANASSAERFYIFFPNGSYDIGSLTGNENQMTTYSRAKTSFIGQSMENVVIYNKAINEGISISATLFLDKNADETYMQDLTLQNKAYVQGAAANRFVALQDRGNKNIYKRVKLLSTQDTYYSTAYEDKSYWEEGEIHGTVDFICGGGDVLFNKCLLYLEERSNNVVTAPANAGKWGYVFLDCTIDGHPVCDNNYRLGRSWNNNASSVFINTTMKRLPNPAAWGDPMNVVPTKFAEYNSVDAHGNPVDLSKRRTTYTKDNTTVTLNPVLSAYEASLYTETNVLDGWLPSEDCIQVAPPVVRVDGQSLLWNDNDSALCYFVFKNDIYVANTIDNSFDLPDDVGESDIFTVRAANAMGGLGGPSNAVSINGEIEIPSVSPDYIFYYGNGALSSPMSNGTDSRWDCTDADASGYGWAITGREDKPVLSGMDIIYEGTTYKTFKNSKGAQNTFYLPQGISVKKVHFIGYSNSEKIAYLTEINGKSLSYSMTITNMQTDYLSHPAVVSYEFDEPVCESFTFTFSESQICFIIALEVEEGECSTTEKTDVLQVHSFDEKEPTYDLLGRPVKKLKKGRIYIQDGNKFLIKREENFR